MKSFFSSFFASLLAIFVASGLIVIILIAIVAGIAASAEPEEELTEKSVLKLDLSNSLKERHNSQSNPFAGGDDGIGLNKLNEVLEDAAIDPNIQGILLKVPALDARPSTALDARKAIENFKSTSGKWIIAYAESYTQGGYFMASAADEVYLYPTGSVDFRGAYAELTFFKNMLDKLGIDIQIIRGKNNKFKSAVEPFMFEKMSDANREQMNLLVGGIWDVLISEVSKSRSIPVEKLNQMADSIYFRTAKNALEGGLVDGLKYEDEVDAMIKEKLSLSDDEEINYLNFSTYARLAEPEDDDDDTSDRNNRIAVVYAVGDIVSGEGDDETIGSDRIAKALRDARLDEKTKAIVLRVNSPGGSALASDVIWRETELIRKDSIPFVVSMGDYAASGGYYIACSADKIFANNNTLTGSIGVFGMVPNMQRFWNDHIGITFDGVKTNAHADLTSLNKPLSEKEHAAIQEMIETIYTEFTSIVAKGRGMTVAEVDSIGQGRVWTGKDALRIGLVDEIGNLNDAITEAAAMAGLESYKVREYPEMVDPFEQMIKELQSSKASAIMGDMSPEVKELIKSAERMQSITNYRGVQARMPFMIEFK